MMEKLTQFESSKDDRGKPTQILSGRVYLQYRSYLPEINPRWVGAHNL